jgi:hypothetical protein
MKKLFITFVFNKNAFSAENWGKLHPGRGGNDKNLKQI